ncbi:MAG: LysR family transcriptional regulator [Clostridiales bacterium]
MNTRYLKYFISVAKYLNFTKAAQECYISQTAMSQHISKMEEELGFKLFFRNNRVVELTPGGKVFLEEAHELVRRYDHAVFWGSVAAMDYKGVLRVGYLCNHEKSFLPNILKEFHQRNPRIEIVLRRDNFLQLLDGLNNNKLDVILVYPYDIPDPTKIKMKSFKYDNVALVVSKDHPLAHAKKVNIDMMRGENFILYSELKFPVMHTNIINQCKEYGFEPKVIGAPQDFDSLLLMIEIGLGVTFIPTSVRSSNNGNLAYIEVENAGAFSMEHSIVSLKENTNPSLNIFWKIVDEMDKDGELQG